MKSLLTRNSRLAIAAGTALCALLNFNASATVPSVIDSAYNSANGHWYYLLSNSTWSSAETAAVGLGGHLVTINDSAENSFVGNMWGANRDLWIGLYDPVVGDGTGSQHAADFQWSSGDTSSYRNWRSGEPNNGNSGEYNAYILAQGLAGAGQWNDGPDVTSVAGQPALYGVVEVPEPSSLAFLAGAAALWGAKRNAKQLPKA